MAARPQGPSDSPAEAVARVKGEFPCRGQAIDLLAAELTQPGCPGTACFVYGPASTGKTTAVRGLLRALRLRHAYYNCNEGVSRLRPLLASILHQLKGAKRQREDGYDTAIQCNSLAEFRNQLPAVVGRRRGACWLVLDNVHRLAGSDLLAALMRVGEDTGAELAVLLIASGGGWASGRYIRDTAAVPPPKEIRFDAYRPQELQRILEHKRRCMAGPQDGEAHPYRQFLTLFVPSFSRASNNLLDLEAAVSYLYPLYVQPLREGKALQGHALYSRIKDDVQRVLQNLQLQHGGPPASLLAAAAAGGAAGGGSGGADASSAAQAAARKASSSGLSFELPYVSKFLLLAAYVASRNKPTTDRAVFDPNYKKRGRKDAQAHDRQVEAAHAAQLRGPHSFPLERLLHIFYAMYAHHDADDEEEEEAQEGQDGGWEAQKRREQTLHTMQQAEVLQQVSSLVSLRLLEQCGGDALEGQLYRCNMSEEVANALAANVKLSLRDYASLG